MSRRRGISFAVAAVQTVRDNGFADPTGPNPFPMAERDQPISRVDASAGHLSVHVEGAHPRGVMFAFEDRRSRMLPSFVSAFGLQTAIVGAFIFLNLYGPTLVTTKA